MKERIYFWVKLVVCGAERYRQITAGIERASRKPQSQIIEEDTRTVYIQYFERIDQAALYMGNCLEHVEFQEQQRLKGA